MKEQFGRLAQRLGTSPRKLGAMVALFAIGLLLWGRLLLKEPPRVATANPPVAGASVVPQAPHDQRLPIVRVQLRPDLERDLFEFVPDRYRPTARIAPVAEPAKSRVTPVDDAKDARNVVEAARRLDLQSVISGSEPHAMINDQMVKPGDGIEGFSVVAVEQRSVILERDGIMIRIGM
jgi:hypothetical protein